MNTVDTALPDFAKPGGIIPYQEIKGEKYVKLSMLEELLAAMPSLTNEAELRGAKMPIMEYNTATAFAVKDLCEKRLKELEKYAKDKAALLKLKGGEEGNNG